MLLLEAREEWNKENWFLRIHKVSSSRLARLPRYLQAENQLEERDWEVLERLEDILSDFEAIVKSLEGDGQIQTRRGGWQGSYGNVWNVILAFELLFSRLETLKQQAADLPDSEQFRINVISLAWKKLDKYYRLLDETPIYYASLALHPGYR
jgi:hypothetical protein